MPDGRDAECRQILGRQVGQDIRLDVIVAKRLGVLAETQALQPLRDIESFDAHPCRRLPNHPRPF